MSNNAIDEIISAHDTEAATVAALATINNEAVPVSVIKLEDGRTMAIRRNDFALDQITPQHAAKIEQPKWVTQAVTVQKALSLSDYVKRFKNEGTLLFADIASDKIVGAIDYHRAPARENPPDAPASAGVADNEALSNPSPRLGTHNVTLQLKRSEEWARWTGQSEKLMDQIDFADFLEENGIDVTDPTGASLLELCRDIHAMSGASVKSAIRQGDVRKLEIQRDNKATTDYGAELPVQFEISIPVYFGESPITLKCMTRVKVAGGMVQLGYKLVRAEQARQEDFQRIVDAVSVDTDTLAVYGAK